MDADHDDDDVGGGPVFSGNGGMKMAMQKTKQKTLSCKSTCQYLINNEYTS